MIEELRHSGLRVEKYEDAAGEHRWRVVSTHNGQVMADSAEGYVDPRDKEHGWVKVLGLTLDPNSGRYVRALLGPDGPVWQEVEVRADDPAD